jgi:hypothetical protein
VRAADEDVGLSIKVAGADVTGPLAFLLLFGGIYAGWSSSTAAKARQQQGRWVYDRSLGGKKVGGGGGVWCLFRDLVGYLNCTFDVQGQSGNPGSAGILACNSEIA